MRLWARRQPSAIRLAEASKMALHSLIDEIDTTGKS